MLPDFQEKTDKKKNSIEKEIEAKISELMKEKDKRLKMADALRANAESSAEKIKREIRESQVELAKLSNDDFDDIDDVKKVQVVFISMKIDSLLWRKRCELRAFLASIVTNKIRWRAVRRRDFRTRTRSQPDGIDSTGRTRRELGGLF